LILDTNALSAIAEGEAGATKKFTGAREVAIPVIVPQPVTKTLRDNLQLFPHPRQDS